jgi:hypothetical protein
MRVLAGLTSTSPPEYADFADLNANLEHDLIEVE